MKRVFGSAVGLFLLLAVAGLVPSSASAGKWINVLPGTELFGCVQDDLAAHLLNGQGFSTTGSPVVIICVAGYTAVYRTLP